MPKRELYVGLMSGTSLDGVDAVVVDLAQPDPCVLAATGLPLEDALRSELLALNEPGIDELGRAALAGGALARAYASAVHAVRAQAGVQARDIRAIGCHGQTVRHRPELGYTIQLGNPALLAELTGIAVACDFRSRDIAAGGQGAPLVPALHSRIFGSAAEDRAVLNLGGIANITWLPCNGTVLGFDSGPANCLLDLWVARHLQRPCDSEGAWGAQGKNDPELLELMQREAYFHAPHPKSTGRDLFNEAWLSRHLAARSTALRPADVQATLMELTAWSVRTGLEACGDPAMLIVCGGGTKNRALMALLSRELAPLRVVSSATMGVDPDYVEAIAFAWLARQTVVGEAGNLPAVTGAQGPRVLGGLYPR